MMTKVKQRSAAAARDSLSLLPLQRKPQRITVTISWILYQRLLRRSDQEGRSLSNLAAHLLEKELPADERVGR